LERILREGNGDFTLFFNRTKKTKQQQYMHPKDMRFSGSSGQKRMSYVGEKWCVVGRAVVLSFLGQ